MEGIKHDNGKLEWDYLDFPSIEELLKVYAFGAERYGKDNWKMLSDAKARYTNALYRHQAAIMKGELVDPDSGFFHAAHVAWNAMTLLYFTLNPEQSNG